MKRIISFLICIMLLFSLTACRKQKAEESVLPSCGDSANQAPQAENDGVESPSSAAGSKVIIAYFSVPEDVSTDGVDAVAGASVVVKEGEKLGNTQYVAQIIQDTIGGELFRIETVSGYPLEHDALLDYASDEQKDNLRPELTAIAENFKEYDTVILGYPNWWYDMPMAMYTFFEEYDFSGKTIIPFNTHRGSRFSSTISTIGELEPNATVLEDGFTFPGDNAADAADDVAAWLKTIAY